MCAKSRLPGKSDRALVGRPVEQTSRSEVRLVDEPFGGKQGSISITSCQKQRERSGSISVSSSLAYTDGLSSYKDDVLDVLMARNGGFVHHQGVGDLTARLLISLRAAGVEWLPAAGPAN